MWPFDDLGSAVGDELKALITSAFESAMKAIWDASLALLRGAFGLADQFSVFTVDTRSGPVSILWPLMLWISGVLAVGLFFWQLTLTSVRGGRGFLRLIGGPMQYGIALAVTVGLVAGFLAAADGLTDGILQTGLRSRNFTDALNATTFGDAAVNGVQTVVLGLCALVGVIPASIGYVLEMLFREAAIYILVGAVPITAAGLLANITAAWFWSTCRWILAAIWMKPVLALALVLGVAIAGGSQGLSGLLAGIGVLVVSLFSPFALYRMFAFVDPHTDAGGSLRDALSGLGVDSYGSRNPAVQAAMGGVGRGGGEAIEAANTDRFDAAVADDGDGAEEDPDAGAPADASTSSGAGSAEASGSASGGGASPAANRGQVVSSSRSSGPTGSYGDGEDSPPPPEPPEGGGGSPPPDDPPGPGPNSGGGGAAGAAEESAVIL